MAGLLTAAAVAELEKSQIHVGLFVELDFEPGVERYWSGMEALDWDGVTWNPTANLGKISAFESSADFRANGLTVSIQGLPGAVLSGVDSLAATDYKGRPARVVVAFMDANFRTVLHAIPRYFVMDMVDYAVDPDEGAGVQIVLESELRRAVRQTVRRYSNQDQNDEFPDDKAFEFISYLNSGVEVKWGVGGAFFR